MHLLEPIKTVSENARTVKQWSVSQSNLKLGPTGFFFKAVDSLTFCNRRWTAEGLFVVRKVLNERRSSVTLQDTAAAPSAVTLKKSVVLRQRVDVFRVVLTAQRHICAIVNWLGVVTERNVFSVMCELRIFKCNSAEFPGLSVFSFGCPKARENDCSGHVRVSK
jgi:hypothetical protein